MKKRMALIIGVSVFLFGSITARAQDLCREPVSTEQGSVTGAPDGAASCAYKGIPYAAAPVGELRWRAPQDPPVRSEALAADSFGSVCPQIVPPTIGGDGKTLLGSEDCLYLNIWRPQKSGEFPVMFSIHGGALTMGSGDIPFFFGDRLASERDVVVVTINYRLGVFGFLGHRAFAAEDPRGSTGDYGLLDQVKALEWVRDNIGEFGGDPNNVTIFGESAGGWAVCMLMASPLTEGLFHRAVIQSAGCEAGPSELALSRGAKVAAEAGCEGDDPASCLRSRTVEELFTAVKGPAEGHSYFFVPVVDGWFLKDYPIESLRSGNYHRVPLMTGSTRDEFKLLTVQMKGIRYMPTSLLIKQIGLGWDQDTTRQFRKMYPFYKYHLPADALIDALGDINLGCWAFWPAEASMNHQPLTFYYRFDYDAHKKPRSMGAFHGSEIPFVFGTLQEKMMGIDLYSKAQLKKAAPLREMMMSYWTNFARTGDPNGPGLPPWPAYEPEQRMRIYLDLPVTARTADNVEKCEFWKEEQQKLHPKTEQENQ